MNPLLSAARHYLAKGFSVIPVGPNKLPLLESWKEFQNRLPDDSELELWFGTEVPPNAPPRGHFAPTKGIAIVTGKLSNLAVVDVDIKNGGIVPIGLPATLTSKTQSGGWHFYFRFLDGLTNRVALFKGVDIRAEGGYVVAPPTVGINGAYEWTVNEDPQPFPADLLKVAIDKPKTDWRSVAEGVGSGNRNETAAKFIGKLIQSFRPEEWENAVWLTALNWNQSNKPPLSDRELRSVFNSITGRELRRLKGVVEDDVPVVLMSEAAKSITDTSLSYSTGFGILDTALSGGVREGNLILIVGPTGHGKSALARTLTYNLLKNQVTSVWFTFELTAQEMWEEFKKMGLEDSSTIYTPERNVSQKIIWLKKKIIEARDRFKSKFVFIDHLGFLIGQYDGDSNARYLSNNLASVYTMICRDLKTIAIQENVVIVLLWHQRRLSQGKTEGDDSDVKDSSGILQECDLGLSVTREILNRGKRFSEENLEDVLGPNSYLKMIKNRRTGILKRFKCRFENGRLIESDDVRLEIAANKDFDSLGTKKDFTSFGTKVDENF